MWLCDQSLLTVGFHERSYHNLTFIRISSENTAFSEGWSWFKFNNLGHAVGGNFIPVWQKG